MKKIELESYLDEYVEVTLFDNFTYRGILPILNWFLFSSNKFIEVQN